VSDDLVRISDDDRERAVASLREHLVQGRLTLEEFAQRMTTAYQARTAGDLTELSGDLPAAAPPSRARSAVRLLVAIFGASRRSGSIRIAERVLCLSIFGSVTLDLRGALVQQDTIDVLAWTLFGSVDVIVPKGVEVDLSGIAVFGAKETRGKPEPLTASGPLVKVSALVVFGAATVKVRGPE